MDALVARVRDVLDAHVSLNSRVVIGFSGGIDSAVLLDVLARRLGLRSELVSAIHVNHQLNPEASRWAAFCNRRCRQLGIALQVVKVDIARGNSTEAAARAARHAVFAESGADVVVLAHNRNDQAETLLLQLLRGAGPRGLAAMPELKTATRDMPAVLRPLLDVPRSEIEAYARRHRLRFVEDESNRDRGYLRNFLRHDIMPVLAARLPAVDVTIARAARLQAEASTLLDELARHDLGAAAAVPVLPVVRLARLSQSRARNLLRYFLRANAVAMPDAVRLDELLRQTLGARLDAQVCVALGGVELRRFNGGLYVVKPLPSLSIDARWPWNGRGTLAIPALGGTLRLARRKNAGIDAALLRDTALVVRVRRGGESLRLHPGGRRRSLRNLMQEAGMPPWQRDRLPCLYIEDRLAGVADLGVDSAFRARPGSFGLFPTWVPD